MSSELTIVMYHYVRDLKNNRYPNIKGLSAEHFRSQVTYLNAHHSIVTMAEVVHSLRTGDRLPPKAALLTFDDGYIDHYTTCFPLLFDLGIQGSFFPPVAPVVRSELLDVNRIHFILSVADASVLAAQVDEYVQELGVDGKLEKPEYYRNKWAKPNRFDTSETIYVKRMLQVALPENIRNYIAQKLFSRYIDVDEKAFAAELYATEEQFRVMQSSGMYIGSHGDTHYWLDSIDATAQDREIRASLDFLRRVGSPIDDFWVMCYPYGAWNESLVTKLTEYNCTAGLTTDVRQACLVKDNPLLLPRFDTNDIPIKDASS